MSHIKSSFDKLAPSAWSRASAYREMNIRPFHAKDTPMSKIEPPLTNSATSSEPLAAGVEPPPVVVAAIVGIALLAYGVLSGLQSKAAMLPAAHEPTNHLLGIGALLLRGLLFCW